VRSWSTRAEAGPGSLGRRGDANTRPWWSMLRHHDT
jgi:hypothetical protein